jgi:metal-dependent hydrolase (beta-lactamase superfamily II)
LLFRVGPPHPTVKVTGSSSDRDNIESSDEESLEKIEQKTQLLAVKAKRMKLAERQRKIEVGQMAMGPHNVTQLNEQLWDALREQEKTRIEQVSGTQAIVVKRTGIDVLITGRVRRGRG